MKMNPAFTYIGLETLRVLYERGFLAAEGLTAIAPLEWLAKNYPELLDEPEKAFNAIAATQDFSKPLTVRRTAQKTCGECTHFSSVHACCMKRTGDRNTYIAVTKQSLSCSDFDRVELPKLPDKRGRHERH